MGTRGFMGFVVDGEEKIAYNHWDSYPAALGATMLDWLRKTMLDDLDLALTQEQVRKLKLVNEDDPFTDDDLLNLARFTDTSVGNQGIKNQVVHDWYQLLRNTQGDPEATLQAGYMIDSHEFPLDSLFAEWGYIVDFDQQVFEVYRGFQHSPPSKGRWSNRGRNAGGYYPCALVASYSFDHLPSNDDFLALEEEDE